MKSPREYGVSLLVCGTPCVCVWRVEGACKYQSVLIELSLDMDMDTERV